MSFASPPSSSRQLLCPPASAILTRKTNKRPCRRPPAARIFASLRPPSVRSSPANRRAGPKLLLTASRPRASGFSWPASVGLAAPRRMSGSVPRPACRAQTTPSTRRSALTARRGNRISPFQKKQTKRSAKLGGRARIHPPIKSKSAALFTCPAALAGADAHNQTRRKPLR